MRRLARLCRCLRHGADRAEHLRTRLRGLPELQAEALLGDGPALVLAPHPDDESLGCGGLIAAASRAGIEVHILVVTDGSGLQPTASARTALMRRRRAETVAAAAILGVPEQRVQFGSLVDGAAPRHGSARRKAAGQIAELARRIGARTILASWEFDSHPDHVAVHRYGQQLARDLQVPLFAYPVWTWMLHDRALMPRLPLMGCTIRIEIETKLQAVMQHRSQLSAIYGDAAQEFSLRDEHLERMVTAQEVYIALNLAARLRLSE